MRLKVFTSEYFHDWSTKPWNCPSLVSIVFQKWIVVSTERDWRMRSWRWLYVVKKRSSTGVTKAIWNERISRNPSHKSLMCNALFEFFHRMAMQFGKLKEVKAEQDEQIARFVDEKIAQNSNGPLLLARLFNKCEKNRIFFSKNATGASQTAAKARGGEGGDEAKTGGPRGQDRGHAAQRHFRVGGGSAKPFGESTNTKSLRAGGSANSRHFPARGKKASVGEESPTLLSVQGKMGGEAKSFRTTGTAALICSNCQGLTDIRPLDFVAKVLEILIMLAERKIHDRTTLWESPFISVCSPLPQHDHRIWTDVSCYNSPWRYSILGEFSHALFCWGQIYVSFNGISIA